MAKMVEIDPSFWKNKRVLLTGHTGFKGSWLLLLLQKLGAEVWGYSHKYEKDSLFELLLKENSINLDDDNWEHITGNILDKERLEKVIKLCSPDIVIHMAAQAIVRTSYLRPIETWETNFNGTLNLLDTLKIIKKKCLILVITTDKVYENNSNYISFEEHDKLGGHDPYSASKAAIEILISSWRNSFLNISNGYNNLKLASARAGNVIGGGDNAIDRIIPDIIRSLLKNEKILIRNPYASRPWQHVLESLNAYLILIQKLSLEDNKIIDCFNFGPNENNSKTVKELVEEATKYWEFEWRDVGEKSLLFESKSINLNITKAKKILGWEPFWDFEKTVKKTILWYKNYYLYKKSALYCCMKDIDIFINKIKSWK